VFEGLARRSPELAARVRVHETGARPPSLDGVAALVFWLSDPLRERFPACYAEAETIVTEARRRGIRIVNPPEALSNTVKSRQARRWRESGIETPAWVRFEKLEELHPLARELGFPLVIRSDEEHSRRGMRLLLGARDVVALREADLWLPAAAAPFYDLRNSWRARDPESPYAQLHHKQRVYVLGTRVRTEYVYFSSSPFVSSKSSSFRRLDRLPRWARRLALLRARERRAIEEDVAFWRHGSAHEALMRRAVEALGLSFAAVDFGVRGDGSVILWEANPYPSLPALSRTRLVELRGGAERIAGTHRALGDFLLGLLGPASR
jgi:hypothetical protein